MQIPKRSAEAEFAHLLSPLNLARAATHDLPQPYLYTEHGEFISNALVRLYNREDGFPRRMMVTMGPRHGKTELCSHWFPTWAFAIDPGTKLILTSYEVEQAARSGRAVRRSVQELYPMLGTRIVEDSRAAHRWDTTRRGGMVSAGVRGPITGKGGSILICDDPIKNPIAADTPVPTTSGWSTMGELRVGDSVFDQAGRPCRVVSVAGPVKARSLRITFSDGSYVDSHPEHPWLVFDRRTHSTFTNGHQSYGQDWWRWKNPRRWKNSRCAAGPRVVKAKDLEVRGHRGMREWTIPAALPLALPECKLPIDPYVLGYWLGDGAACTAAIACHADDVRPLRAAVEAAGYHVTRTHAGRTATYLGISLHDGGSPPSHDGYGDSLPKRLRGLGIWTTKDVPGVYLRASAEQRLALLRGLMDSDGTASDQAIFCNTNRRIVDAVHELVVSLGASARVTTKANAYGQYYTVAFTSAWNPFQLPRKASAWSLAVGAASIRRLNRTIAKIEVRMEVVDHVCVGVDAESHLFLVGAGMIPTHNSEEANSGVIRDSIWDWWTTTFLSREQPNDAGEAPIILLIMTRWHEADLAGRIMDSPEWKNWHHIFLPAIAENEDPLGRQPGEALWPERFDALTLEGKRAEMGSRAFQALYQGNPQPPGGIAIQRSWWRYYDTPPPIEEFDQLVISVDPTFKGNSDSDYVAMGVMGRKGAQFYLLDIVHKQMNGPDTIKAIVGRGGLDERWPQVKWLLIEDTASGSMICDILERDRGHVLRGRHKSRQKEVRLNWQVNGAAALIERGAVYVRGNDPIVKKLVDEGAAFPHGAHDDLLDMLVQGLEHLLPRAWAHENKIRRDLKNPEPTSYTQQMSQELWSKVRERIRLNQKSGSRMQFPGS